MPKCSLCSDAHATSRCPELWNPLKEGFFEGGGSQGGHSHDDDDEKVDSVGLRENRSQDSIKTIDFSRNGLCNLLRCDHRGHGQIGNELRP